MSEAAIWLSATTILYTYPLQLVRDRELVTLGNAAPRVRQDPRALLPPERKVVRIIRRAELRRDRPVRPILNVLEYPIDGVVRLLVPARVDGPLVVQPEERASRHAVRHDERRQLRLRVRGPLERARVHGRGANRCRVDVHGGEGERLGSVPARVAHRRGEGFVVVGDGGVEGVVAEGEVDATLAVGRRADALDGARLKM